LIIYVFAMQTVHVNTLNQINPCNSSVMRRE
jgi:hypothetical protein